jgi:hypothetical protein
MLFDFTNPGDTDFLSRLGFPQEMFNEAITALEGDRVRTLRLDAFRSLAFIVLAAGLIWLYLKNKLKMAYVVAGLALLILIDMWVVNKRYLNDDNFVRRAVVENPFQPNEADKQIMQDRSPGYRVLNLTVDPFSDASTSYFHHSIGGYHGAKLKRYQELIELQISPEMARMMTVLRSSADPGQLDGVLRSLPVLNMLNTRYLIIMSSNGPMPVMNPNALGAAWFVDDYEVVEDADAEIIAIGDIDPSESLVVDRRFAAAVEGKSFMADSSASITLEDYKPNHLTYKTNALTEQLAVFSEVYYPNGWYAYIDGEAVEHFRANWILRAMTIPAGSHTVEFKFDPGIYSKGEMISLASSILLLLLVLVYCVFEVRKKL